MFVFSGYFSRVSKNKTSQNKSSLQSENHGKGKDDEHDQEPLPEDLLNTWSGSSENLILKGDKNDDHDQDSLKKDVLLVWDAAFLLTVGRFLEFLFRKKSGRVCWSPFREP